MTLAVGDKVLFEGLECRVSEFPRPGVVKFDSLLAQNGKPRFRTEALENDLRWSDFLGAWYIWGRVLSKGRGGVLQDQRAVVAMLRDHGVIPARETRRLGSMPAGGEHVNLWCLFREPAIDWKLEMQSARLSDEALKRIKEYAIYFRQKLADGYANPDADDSWEE